MKDYGKCKVPWAPGNSSAILILEATKSPKTKDATKTATLQWRMEHQSTGLPRLLQCRAAELEVSVDATSFK